MKRILFVTPSLRIGGMERMQVTLANKLADAGYEVTVMLLEPVNTLAKELDERIRCFYHPPRKPSFGKKIPYIRHKFFDDGMREKRTSMKNYYKFYVGKEKYDVEIAFFSGTSIKIIGGSTNSSAVRLAWIHGDFRYTKFYMINFRDIEQVREAYASCDKVVCVSDMAREGFIETIGDTHNTVTVYNMLPVDDIRKKAEENAAHTVKRARLHAVIVSRLLDSTKGQSRLIEAVCRLRGEGADISLSIVGGGGDRDKLNDLIRDRGAGEYIEMPGEKENPYPYIKSADLLVCSSYHEGYNLTVAEALILGVPVLSTDCVGPNEILDHGKYGMIVENSEEGLYAGLKQLCGSPELLEDYRLRAERRRDFFDEDRILKQITDLFERRC